MNKWLSDWYLVDFLLYQLAKKTKNDNNSVTKQRTQYIVSVHPSHVMHVKTVNILSNMLSKLVMPTLGPSQLRAQTVPAGHTTPLFPLAPQS